MSIRLSKFSEQNRAIILLPTLVLATLRHYYGYPVLGITLGWLNWQIVIKLGVKKVREQ